MSRSLQIRTDYFTMDDEGNCRWFSADDLLHRENGPALERADGSKFWYKNGQLHRDGGPAIEFSDGTKLWFKKGLLHRSGGPAIEATDGSFEWWKKGVQTLELKAA